MDMRVVVTTLRTVIMVTLAMRVIWKAIMLVLRAKESKSELMKYVHLELGVFLLLGLRKNNIMRKYARTEFKMGVLR